MHDAREAMAGKRAKANAPSGNSAFDLSGPRGCVSFPESLLRQNIVANGGSFVYHVKIAKP